MSVWLGDMLGLLKWVVTFLGQTDHKKKKQRENRPISNECCWYAAPRMYHPFVNILPPTAVRNVFLWKSLKISLTFPYLPCYRLWDQSAPVQLYSNQHHLLTFLTHNELCYCYRHTVWMLCQKLYDQVALAQLCSGQHHLPTHARTSYAMLSKSL